MTKDQQGLIVLVRHGKPALSRKVRLTSSEYRDWWAKYEDGGLDPDQTIPESLKALASDIAVVLSSSRLRAIETARATGRDFQTDPLFIEAPLPPPPLPAFIRLRPGRWGVIARAYWWCLYSYGDGGESRKEAEKRADQAAETLITTAQNRGSVLLVAHGYFNYMVGKALRRRGWKLNRDEGFRYWSARQFKK